MKAQDTHETETAAPVERLIERYGGVLALVWTAVIAMVVVAAAVLQIPIQKPWDYNEGWNAFQAAHAFGAAPLYPDLGAPISNNYPPLSFYVVGALGLVVGDNIVAGRIVSLLSLLVVTATIGWVANDRLNRGAANVPAGRFPAAFAAVLFLATFCVDFGEYVGMNDPQLLAHATQIIAIAWLLHGGPTVRAAGGAAVIIAGSLLIKHNLIAMPAAMAVWLLMYNWRAALVFMAAVAAIVAASFGIFSWVYGPNFLAGVLKAPRTYSLGTAAINIHKWLSPQGGLLAVGFFVVALRWRDPHVRFLGMFAAVSVVLGAALAGGDGMDFNTVFDVTIALCLLSAWAIAALGTQARQSSRHNSWTVARLQFAAAIALSLIAALSLPSNLVGLTQTVADADRHAAESGEHIAMIANHDDPVVCEQLAMCYWAGKRFEMDLFNLGQKLRTGLVTEAELIERIARKEFSLFYIERGSDRLTEPVYQSLETHYEKFHTSDSQEFWRPRAS